jgi:predicted acetyltransferase
MEQELANHPFQPPGQKGWVVVDEKNSALVARYRHLELSQFFAGALFPMAGVAGVAVAIERRSQGIARWMLEQALKDFREQQIPISMLYPFQHGFYRSLGWASVGRSHQYCISTRHLPIYPERMNLIAYDPSQEATWQAVYQKAAMHQNGWLQRTDWQWQQFFKLEGSWERYGYQEAGVLLGYVVIQFTHLQPGATQLVVVVHEWVALTVSAYRGILGFLASLRDQFTTVVWNTHPEDPFPHLVKEQRRDLSLPMVPFEFGLSDAFGEIGSGFMWRLVDLKTAFEIRPIQVGSPFAIAFNVTDAILGNQSLVVEFCDRQMHVIQTPAPTTIHLSIEHLTILFAGQRRSRDLLWLGEIEISGDETLLAQLDNAWEIPYLFCWDSF